MQELGLAAPELELRLASKAEEDEDRDEDREAEDELIPVDELDRITPVAEAETLLRLEELALGETEDEEYDTAEDESGE
jgi:hypothetical protein